MVERIKREGWNKDGDESKGDGEDKKSSSNKNKAPISRLALRMFISPNYLVRKTQMPSLSCNPIRVIFTYMCCGKSQILRELKFIDLGYKGMIKPIGIN